MKFFELFAGAGGLSMGLEMAGWECVGHAEIEPHARAVLRKRWPGVPLLGDVAAIKGRTLPECSLISGGSPCQDLSVAGLRAGLKEGSGTRSSLFFEQMRIWEESGATFCLWENVLGALSSHQGKDFARVLTAFVGGAVTVPRAKRRAPRLRWGNGGIVRGPRGVAAWRVLDAQFFGVPQRRRRVFVLGVRGTDLDPGAVLSLGESLFGDIATSSESREGTPGDPEDGAREAVYFEPRVARNGRGAPSRVASSLKAEAGQTGKGDAAPHVVAPTLSQGAHPGSYNGQDGPQIAEAIILASGQANAESSTGVSTALTALTALHEAPIVLSDPIPLQEVGKRTGKSASDPRAGIGIADAGDPMYTLQAGAQHGVVAFDAKMGEKVRSAAVSEGVNPTLGTNGGRHAVISFDVKGTEVQNDKDITQPMRVENGGGHLGIVEMPEAIAFKPSHFTRGKDGAPSDIHPPLAADADKGDQDPVVMSVNNDSRGTAESGIAAPQRGGDRSAASVLSGVPRRLTPRECERLMSWGDDHTRVGIDENGKEYVLSDSARYRLCGNGVASVQVAWIGFRLREALV